MKTNNNQLNTPEEYEAPVIEIIEVAVEHGFALSDPMSADYGEEEAF
jgi:hypothetical protein